MAESKPKRIFSLSFDRSPPRVITNTSTERTAISTLIFILREKRSASTSTPPVEAPRLKAVARDSAVRIPPMTDAEKRDISGVSKRKIKRFVKTG